MVFSAPKQPLCCKWVHSGGLLINFEYLGKFPIHRNLYIRAFPFSLPTKKWSPWLGIEPASFGSAAQRHSLWATPVGYESKVPWSFKVGCGTNEHYQWFIRGHKLYAVLNPLIKKMSTQGFAVTMLVGVTLLSKYSEQQNLFASRTRVYDAESQEKSCPIGQLDRTTGPGFATRKTQRITSHVQQYIIKRKNITLTT